jgi:3-hydroxyacyl-CoA dehydrogenase/enoyl-CoA hydratase/3-hydroxybutyryl-CoA epimerase
VTTLAAQETVRFQPPDEDGIARVVIDRPDSPINAINVQLVEDLTEAVHQARAASPRGLIVASAKNGQFVAGADLTAAIGTAEAEAVVRRYQATLDELAWLPFTTVAPINGTALGGGLELALACDYRVAVDASTVSIGQPEVNLGLLPAGGGTQRLPRLIGLERALDLILNGRRLNARRARRAGIVDEVVHPSVLDQAARRWATKPKRTLDRSLHLGLTVHAAVDLAEQTPAGRQLIYRQARDKVLKRTGGHYPAPLRALEAVEIGFERGMAAGLEAEATAFTELAASETARDLIWLFMETQRRRRRAQSVGQLGVVGAGFMGAAIAEVSAAAGMPVRVRDISPESVARGLATVRKLVDEGVSRHRFDRREGQDILNHVSGTTDYSGFLIADLVIEAVFEDLAIKRKVIEELEAVLKPEAVIASNTSALPIKDIASSSAHPERIVGMHFFSPAQRMPLLEVVRPAAAADWAVERAVGVGAKMGKTTIVVADSPGFYTSRVLAAMMNEAALTLDEGARLEDVDRALTDFGFPVGPFVLYDEVGLEVAMHAGETVARAFGDRLPAATIVTELVQRGQTGRKTGAGFYLWAPPTRISLFKRERKPNPLVYRNGPRRTFMPGEIQERLVLLFVNEAVRCLDEGVLESAADGDIGAVLGLGFPPFLGGPFHYADSIPDLKDRLTKLASGHGVRYEPAQSINQRRRFHEERK